MVGLTTKRTAEPPDDESLGTVTTSNVSQKKRESPMAQRQAVRRDMAELLAIIDKVFQHAFLYLLEQDLHRRQRREAYEWKIILEAYLVMEIPAHKRLNEVANRFYDLPFGESYSILLSLGHQTLVSI